MYVLTESRPCSWCNHDEGLLIDDGRGTFRDLDSDFGPNFPVCHQCGGLSVEYKTADFRERTQRISNIRTKAIEEFGEAGSDINRIRAIKREVRDRLYKEAKKLLQYYEGTRGCYAQFLATDPQVPAPPV